MTPWDEYLAAAQRLDAARRAAVTLMAEHAAAVQAARDDLAAVRARQAIQHARLVDMARQAGVQPPVLTPQPADLAAAQAALGAAAQAALGAAAQAALGASPTPQAVRASLHTARATLDTADAVLSGVGGVAAGPPRSPRVRNALIYGGYALLAVIGEIAAFLTVREGTGALLVVGCGLVLPVFVFALGWLTAGAFRPVSRTPGLGVAVSLLALVPLLTMVVWVTAGAFGR